MTGAEAVTFVLIIVLSVVGATGFGGWATKKAASGEDRATVAKATCGIVGLFSVMFAAGLGYFFVAASFSPVAWTMVVCGAVCALVLLGNHLTTVRKQYREAELRATIADDL